MRVPRLRITVRTMMVAVAVIGSLLALSRLDFSWFDRHAAKRSQLNPGQEVVTALDETLFVAAWAYEGRYVSVRPGTRAVVIHDDWDDKRDSPGARPVDVRLLEGNSQGVVVMIYRRELRSR